MRKRYLLITALFIISSCGGGGGGGGKENTMVDISTFANPEPNIPTECYTDTGIVRYGKPVANPCYVCHTTANTPYINEVEDYDLAFNYSFPESIVKIGNPWLNAIKPELTLKDIPVPSDSEVESYLKQDNWSEAYDNRGNGDLKYFPDVPPLYTYNNSEGYDFKNIDSEGFLKDPNTGDYTGWRVFKWKPFPGFFPTNGRIDSTIIRLDKPFREKSGAFNLNVYKKNLAIVECAVKGVGVGELCKNTEIGDFTVPPYYEGDASNIPVIVYQYPPGTEFAHPLYYLDPDNKKSYKALHLKEMRYMKKISYADLRKGGAEEEEEEEKFFYDKGLVFNDSGNWLMGGFIEDAKGKLRPQTAEEMKFCVACHGGIGGTVDATFTYWRKVPGKDGWMEQDYNLTKKNIKDWNYKNYEGSLGPELEKLIAYVNGEYQLYFTMTDGGDHFRSNEEIRSRISKDPNKISFIRSPNNNILINQDLINYLDSSGYIKPELFLPSKERAYGIDKQYMRIVKAQAFRFGRDVFDRPFGISSGGNSLESLNKLKETGVKDAGIWVIIKTLLSIE